MKEKQNRRWGLLLISFLCAFLVWLGVVNVADPVMTDTVEVPVEIINSDVLTKNNLTYAVVGKSTTTVQYEVKTTNAYRIRSSDFRAYADMTDMWSVTGAIPIKVEVLNHSEYLVSMPVSRTGTIKIETEPLQRKTFTIGVMTTGMLEDGYQTGKVTLSPETLTVEGPESLIGQISSVGIEINLDGKNADWSDSEEPKFYDANKNSITISDRLISNCKSVDYTMEILKVKNLSLDFDVTGEVAGGYRYTGVECGLKSVPVVGLKSALASLNTITIPKEELDVSGARANIVKTIDLNDYLPEGVSLAGKDSSEITVTLTVEQLKEREYTVRISAASYVGADSSYSYRADPGTVTVRIRCQKEVASYFFCLFQTNFQCLTNLRIWIWTSGKVSIRHFLLFWNRDLCITIFFQTSRHAVTTGSVEWRVYDGYIFVNLFRIQCALGNGINKSGNYVIFDIFNLSFGKSGFYT